MDNKTIRSSVEIWLNGTENEKNELISTYGHISEWDVSKVTYMSRLFYKTSFNENINKWDVSNVRDMSYMFYNATSFNQNINNWNVSNVKNMKYMFNNATSFNQNISNWNISNNAFVNNMFCFNSSISFYKLKTTSFFDEPYKSMNSVKRKRIFNVLFHWDRRYKYVMFLTHYGYIITQNKN